MPTYDYECKDCGHTFEHFQSMSEDPLKICPECGGVLRRLIGGGMGIIFKGSGFYVTDNRKGNNDQNKSSGSKQTDSSTATETKKDTVSANTSGASGTGTGKTSESSGKK